MLRKLAFDMIYYAYQNKSPFKYSMYKHFRGMGGLRPCLFCLFRGAGGPEFGKTCLYDNCTLPYRVILFDLSEAMCAIDFLKHKLVSLLAHF